MNASRLIALSLAMATFLVGCASTTKTATRGPALQPTTATPGCRYVPEHQYSSKRGGYISYKLVCP